MHISQLTGHILIWAILILFQNQFTKPVVAQPAWETKLTPSELGQANFGESVAFFQNRALVGAPISSGEAYIFELQEDNWLEVAKLTASDGGGNFGGSVSMSGNRVLVGAYGNGTKGTFSGSAYIFELVDGSWIEVAKLTASDGIANDQFGNSVSLSGDRALVGAWLNDDAGINSGAAYVFEYQNGAWTEVAILNASDEDAGDGFGGSVSISGDIAVIGAKRNDDNEENSGSAYVFQLKDGNWTEVAKLVAENPVFLGEFGAAVSVLGERILVGATGSGTAHVYEMRDGIWTEVASLIPAEGTSGARYGQSVALSDNRAIIGADLDDDTFVNSGSAYVFEELNGTWVENFKLLASDSNESDNLGTSVALSGNLALVGASDDSDLGFNVGSAYVFDLSIGPPEAIEETIEVLAHRFNDLAVAASLDPLLANRTSRWLDKALGAVEQGNYVIAISHLTKFISQVERLTPHKLTNKVGGVLIEDANEIIASIEDQMEETASRIDQHKKDTLVLEMPDVFELGQNHPNPFNPTTTIHFILPEQAQVRLTVYDMLGREVQRLVDGVREAGNHEITFEASGLPSGTYLYRLDTPAGNIVQKMQLLK